MFTSHLRLAPRVTDPHFAGCLQIGLCGLFDRFPVDGWPATSNFNNKFASVLPWTAPVLLSNFTSSTSHNLPKYNSYGRKPIPRRCIGNSLVVWAAVRPMPQLETMPFTPLCAREFFSPHPDISRCERVHVLLCFTCSGWHAIFCGIFSVVMPSFCSCDTLPPKSRCPWPLGHC